MQFQRLGRNAGCASGRRDQAIDARGAALGEHRAARTSSRQMIDDADRQAVADLEDAPVGNCLDRRPDRRDFIARMRIDRPDDWNLQAVFGPIAGEYGDGTSRHVS